MFTKRMSLFFACCLASFIQLNAQTITNLRLLPTVPLFTDSVFLEVTTFYTFGGGGQGPRAENPRISQNGDTLEMMGFYNFGGPWPAFMSGSVDTIALGRLDTGNFTIVYHLTSYDDYNYDTTFSVDTDTLDFYVTKPFGISEDPLKNTWSFYPNPAKEFVELNTTQDPKTIDEISLLAANGKICFSLKSPSKVVELPKYLPSGIYLLQIKVGERVSTKQLIISP